MADVEAAVQARLVAHAGTTALIAGRAFYGMLPQDPTLPASVIQQITGNREYVMGGPLGEVGGLVQVRACARTRAAAKGLAEQQRAALEFYDGASSGTTVLHAELENEATEYEAETKVWSVRQDWRVWWEE